MRLDIFQGFELVDMLQDFISFEHTRCYRDAGSFTLVLNSLAHKDSLRIGNIIMLQEEAMIIENVHQYSTGSHELRLEITGRSLSSLLDRRVIARFAASTGQTFAEQIYGIVNENFITPLDPKRKIEHMEIADGSVSSMRPAESYLYENMDCLSVIKELCRESGQGFSIQFRPEAQKMVFALYQGRDLTDEVFFCEEYGNVSDTEIYEQTKDYKNAAYTSANGTLTEVAGEASGMERREMIVTGGQGSALAELGQRSWLSAAECAILLNGQFVYREDWDIGDTVTFTDYQLGFLVEQPILEVKEIYGSNREIEVNFGDKIPTVFEKLKGR